MFFIFRFARFLLELLQKTPKISMFRKN